VRANHILYLDGVRKEDLDFNPIAFPDRVHAVIGLLIEAPCIQREYPKIGSSDAMHHIYEY